MAKRKHRKKIFNRKYGIFEVFLEFIILGFLIKPMFNLGLFTGIAYLFALVGSILSGLFFRKRKMARFIVIGTLVGWGAGFIFKQAFYKYQANDPVSFLIVLVLAIVIWYKGFKMRKGKR